jgi:hypothetical protein
MRGLNRKDKARAIELRKSGKSYREIGEVLKIPKSTLSEWFSREAWSKDLTRSLREKHQVASKSRLENVNKKRKETLNRVYEEAGSQAAKDFELLRLHPLFLTGLCLYWGEGDTVSKYQTRIANTDPRMISAFSLFLKRFGRAPEQKLKVWLLLPEDLNEQACKEYWVQKCGLKYEQFTKSTIIQGKNKARQSPNGTCYLTYSSRIFKEKMLVWLQLLPEELLKETRENFLRA